MSPVTAEQLATLRALISQQRLATLAVTGQHGTPETALVAYAMDPAGNILLHLSNLSAHKQALLSHPACSLLIHEPDDGRSQPLMLQRASLHGKATLLDKESAAFAHAAECYLTKLPASKMMFSLGDFDLLSIHIKEIRYIAGFGQAFTIAGQHYAG
jgi:heme iron utilization protein